MSNEISPLIEVRSLFVRRFNLREGDDSEGLRAIDAAIAAGADADIAGLRVLLLQRYQLYPQFEPRVRALLDSLAVPADEAGEDGDASPAKSISRMNKAELAARAEERGIDPTDATVAELRDALHEDENE